MLILAAAEAVSLRGSESTLSIVFQRTKFLLKRLFGTQQVNMYKLI